MQEKSTDDLVSALLRASRVLVGVAARSLEDIHDVVTLAQFRALVVLDGHGDINLSQLAGRLGVNSSTALRMIDRLVRNDLVARRPHPDNRREVLVSLTPDGQNVVDQVTSRRRNEIAAVAEQMPADTREAFVSALEAFSTAAREPELPERHDGLLWGWSAETD